MSRRFSVKEIETLCQILKKEKYKDDPSDLEAYKEYLGRLHYKELLVLKNIKPRLDKLQQTYIAGDTQKKEELEPKIGLLKDALEAVDAGEIEIDESDKKSSLKKIVSVDFALTKNMNKNKNLSTEEQILKLNESTFYIFTVNEILSACDSDEGWTVTFDPEFILSLCRIFAKNEDTYMSVVDKLQKSAGSYEATESYYQRVESAFADYRATEKEKRRINQVNVDELLNDMETRLMKCMDSCMDTKVKLAMLQAMYFPECVVALCNNRDIQVLDKVTIEDAAVFIASLENSSKYGLKAKVIRNIAPYVNVELKEPAGASNTYSSSVEELMSQQKEEQERQKTADLKRLNEILPYFARVKACRDERMSLPVPQKARLGCGTIFLAVIIGVALATGQALLIGMLADKCSAVDDFISFIIYDMCYGDLDNMVIMIFYVPIIIFVIIIISIAVRKNKQKNEQIDKMISYIAELEKKEQEQQQLGNRAAAGILPDNMRNYDAVRELINMLEYKRAASLGEAMNILEMQKNSSSYNNY